jgi:hypothetical protein
LQHKEVQQSNDNFYLQPEHLQNLAEAGEAGKADKTSEAIETEQAVEQEPS